MGRRGGMRFLNRFAAVICLSSPALNSTAAVTVDLAVAIGAPHRKRRAGRWDLCTGCEMVILG